MRTAEPAGPSNSLLKNAATLGALGVCVTSMLGMSVAHAADAVTDPDGDGDDDGKKVVDPFVQKTRFDVNGQPTAMTYPILLGDDDIATKFGGLLGMPTTFLINRDGKIAKKYIGILSEPQITKDVKAQLGAS